MFTSTPPPLKLYVCFLPATEELRNTHWLNRVAAYFGGPSVATQPMIHTELLFAEQSTDSEIIGNSCSIHYNGEVFLESKRFSRTEWHFRECPWDIDAAMEFCKQHVGERFNHVGYYLNPLCAARMSRNRWFCSEIVAGALRAAGADVAQSLHPQRLFESLQEITTPACPRQPPMHF